MNRMRTATALAFFTVAFACSAAAVKNSSPGAALFPGEKIPLFQIRIAPAEFEQLRRTNRTYVRATIVVGTNILRDAGVRLKGHGSFRPLEDKPSLTVKFDEFVAGQKLYGLTKILLNNASQDTSLLSEYIAAGMFRDAGVPAARVAHARVQLNARDLGFYVLAEGMNKVFLKQHFNDATGNLYDVNAQDIDGRLIQSNGAPGDRSDVAALIAAARLPPDERATALPKVLDVDRFLSFLAISMLAAQHDSYPLNRNNYRLYHDPGTKRFVMLPHGIDGSFSRIGLPIELPPQYVLTKAIAETPHFHEAYRARVAGLFTNVFTLDQLTNRIHAAAQILQSAAANETERTGLALRAAGFARRVIERHRSVADQLAGINVAPLELRSAETLRLTNWISDVNRGDATFRREEQAGQRALHISTGTGDSIGSWRQRLLLAPGSYRFQARVQFAGANGNPAGRVGVAIRISGRSLPLRTPGSGDWTSLEFPFSVREGEEDVQLICESRGPNVQAWFDLDSLVLRRE
jgi:spore coat protein H